MLRTISVGNHILVQGTYVRRLPDGRIVVRVGQREYAGTPVVPDSQAA